MPAALVRGLEVGARVPALGQLLEGGHVHDPVVQVVDELGHVPGEEGLVGAHRVARQLGDAGFGHEGSHVVQDGLPGLRHGQAVGELVEQPRGGVHLAHEVAHALQRRRRRPDEHVDALAQRAQLVVGDHDGDLDERVGAQVQAGHLAVDPHQGVGGRHLLAHGRESIPGRRGRGARGARPFPAGAAGGPARGRSQRRPRRLRPMKHTSRHVAPRIMSRARSHSHCPVVWAHSASSR